MYGHIDYVVRYGPDKNKYYSCEKYADIIDAILKESQSEQMPTSPSMWHMILTRFQISSRMPGLCTIQYLKTAFLLSSNYSPALKAYIVILSNY